MHNHHQRILHWFIKLVGDERRIVFLNKSVDIPPTSNDTRQVTEVVSLMNVKQRQERALAILRKTFSTSRSAPPSRPPCPTTPASTANHSNARLEITSLVHLRQDNVIAPLPPATKRRNVFQIILAPTKLVRTFLNL